MNTIATAQPTLKICKLHEEAQVPQAATAGSVGLDLSSLSSIEILPNRLVPNAYIVHTGIAVEIPKGYHGKVFLRSSIGAKTKLRLANGTGIIDSDYFFSDNEGHIFIKLTNDTKEDKTVELSEGAGFAQGIFFPFGITEDDDSWHRWYRLHREIIKLKEIFKT